MSGNDCWNSVCFSCCRKADNELADVTLSGRLFQTVESVNGSILQTGVLVDQTRRRHGPTNWGSTASLHAEPCVSEQPFCTVSVLEPATSHVYLYYAPHTEMFNNQTVQWNMIIRTRKIFPNIVTCTKCWCIKYHKPFNCIQCAGYTCRCWQMAHHWMIAAELLCSTVG